MLPRPVGPESALLHPRVDASLSIRFILASLLPCASTLGTESDVLGWAPDAPLDLSGQVVRKLIGAARPTDRQDVRRRVDALLEKHVPTWASYVLPEE